MSLGRDVAEAEVASVSGLDSKSAEQALQPALAFFKEVVKFGRCFGNLPEAIRVSH